MVDYTAKRVADMEAVFRGSFRKARAELGVTSFGLQILEFPPNANRYPEHDHAPDGQEEVYVVLSGSGEMEVDGDRIAMEPETLIRVGPGAKRKLTTAAEPMNVLVIGGVPGRAYEVVQFTELGEPDPLAR
jgi:mannose-6-phosphate isomerase-like protein (cupin superfamily)